jgi:hypothetical protein
VATATDSVLPSLLIAASAAVVFTLGALHLWYTFRGNTLHPRDPERRVRLEQVPLVLNRHTSMWRAWVGFTTTFYVVALVIAGL